MKKQSPPQTSNQKMIYPNLYQIIGTVMIVAAFFFTDVHFVLPIAAIAWGALIIVIDLYLRYRSAREEREIQSLKIKNGTGSSPVPAQI